MLRLNVGFYGRVTHGLRRHGTGRQVKFGAPLAFSGSTAMIGQSARQGLQMAVDEMNAQTHGRITGKL